MPKIARDDNERSLSEDMTPHFANISITTKPVLITGVNRKANVGNFETVDVYAGLAIPIDIDITDNMELLAEMVEQAANYGFALTSKEVADRYHKIKSMVASEDPPAQ